MKTTLKCSRSLTGSALMAALVVAGLMAFVLFSYMAMVGSQTGLTARSQAWNSCIAVAEAGAEEAMAHLNENGTFKLGQAVLSIDLASNGWNGKSGGYYLQRPFRDGYYEVTIVMGVEPVITSTGYVPVPGPYASAPGPVFATSTAEPWKSEKKFLSRTVRVVVQAVGSWNKAIVARDKIELNGKYIVVDSYHSYDPALSTYDGTNGWGSYDPAKRRDRADLAVMEGMKDELKIDDAKVFGKVATSPTGKIDLSGNAVVGSVAWHEAGNKGVEPGWSSYDVNFDMPQVTFPFSAGATPTGGYVGTNYFDYILGDGDYLLSKLNGKVLVSGKARLLVKDEINFKDGANDDEGILFEPNAHLELYMAGDDAKLVGKKDPKKGPSFSTHFNPGGNATNFFYFGGPKNKKLELSKMDTFIGIVYAPNAEVVLKGGSIKYYRCHLHGAIQGKKVKLEKNANVHYDENIGILPASKYMVKSWAEI